MKQLMQLFDLYKKIKRINGIVNCFEQVCSDKQNVWLNIVIFWNYFVHRSCKK